MKPLVAGLIALAALVALGLLAWLALAMTRVSLAPALATSAMPPLPEDELPVAPGRTPRVGSRPGPATETDSDAGTRVAVTPDPADVGGDGRRVRARVAVTAGASPEVGDPAADLVERPVRIRVAAPRPIVVPRGMSATSQRARVLRGAAARGEDVDGLRGDDLLEEAAHLERSLEPFVDALVQGELARDQALAVLGADQALVDRFDVPDDASVIDGATWDGKSALPDVVVMRFSPGVFRFDPDAVQRLAQPPRLVVVEGSGMDETVLARTEKINGDERPRWVFRDCTVDCAGTEFLHGGKDVEVWLERVRVLGCDTGAGGSEMFDNGGLVFAVDSRFEEGFAGRGGTNLFEGKHLYVRLDRCTFVGPFGEFARKATVLATDCDFEWTPRGFAATFEALTAEPDARAQNGAKVLPGVRFLDCSVLSVVETKDWPRRVLSEFNPKWPTERR